MLKKICTVSLCALVSAGAFAAVATKSAKQSAIQNTTTVRTRVAATGLYDQECYDAYYGCMDQFCITDNSNGGSCACSDDNAAYEKKLAEIKDILVEAERISTEEVERIQAGANADIIFAGTRQYDENGNVIDSTKLTAAEEKEQKRADLMALFETNLYDDEEEDVFGDDEIDIFSLTGTALHSAANDLCMQQIPEKCGKDAQFLRQVYQRQIVSDCKGFENSLDKQMKDANATLAAANAAVRGALRDSFNAANKYDRGQCMVEFKKCMLTDDACGKDWINCVSVIASENMQNNVTESTAGTTVATVDKYDITASTMEILESKRNICENVLNQCVAVRDMVWPDFLREAAPTIKVAESAAESKFRQSCLTNISNCIQTACKDDIAGKGVATMDACLSRPDMARSFCKVEIDPCERMEPLIWGYVTDKLAAMRVDACTQEVKDCFTADTRCGENFQNCIGMDYNYIHDICPVDSLVVCKANNPSFSMDDLDSMLMGLYLNIDNSALEQCQNLVDAKMAEVCGSTTDCNKFAADDTIGTGSLNYQKAGNIHRMTGMLSIGQIQIGDGIKKTIDKDGNEVVIPAGNIDVYSYVKGLSDYGVPENYVSVADTIVQELYNIQGKINNAVNLIEQDPEIQFCINGRDLSQITGKNEKTTARFPNLLNQVKMQIAVSALKQVSENYNKKYNELMSRMTQESSVDMANLMCNKLPQTNGQVAGVSAAELDTTGVAAPFAYVLEMGGVSNSSLAAGGSHSSSTLGGARQETASGAAAGGSDGGTASTVAAGAVQAIGTGAAIAGAFVKAGGEVAMKTLSNVAGMASGAMVVDATLKAVVALASDKRTVEFDGGTREMWSVFNRETRICHYCTSTITKDCKTKGSRGFLGLWDSRGVECTSSEPVEVCEDIPM